MDTIYKYLRPDIHVVHLGLHYRPQISFYFIVHDVIVYWKVVFT